jgi:uncharacterized protein YbjT (DUF2867 family)
VKVLVVGATGLTGSILVRLLFDRGDEVTALVRSDVAMKRLRVVRGDARDRSALEAAVEGQDAVLSAFGPRGLKKDDLQEAYMRNLVAAMDAKGVKRLVNLSAWGAGDSWDSMPFVGKMFVRLLLSELYADKNRGETILLASGLDFINVRPGRLTNGKARGGVKASADGKGISSWMTREDLAAFMVSQLEDPTWVRKSPVIGY